jgi:hypothetical protein
MTRYRISLRSRTEELRRSIPLVTLDKYETQKALTQIAKEETLHLGDIIRLETYDGRPVTP